MTPPNLPPLPLVDGALLLDNSAIEKMKCPRLFEYDFLHRRVLSASKAGRNFGSGLHAGWAQRYTTYGNKAVTHPDIIESAMKFYFAENPQPQDDFRNFNHACRVMAAYNKVYQDEPFKIITNHESQPIVESSFALPFGTVAGIPIIYTGKLDLACTDNVGIWCGPDHKTTFQFGDTFDQQMAVDGGQMGYVWALWQTLGTLPTGYIIDAVRIRKPRRDEEYTGKAPIDASDFKRFPVFITEEDMTDWLEDTHHIIETIIGHYQSQYFPRHRWNCTNKFGTCDFYDTCSLRRSQRASALASNIYEDNHWTPLKGQNDEIRKTNGSNLDRDNGQT